MSGQAGWRIAVPVQRTIAGRLAVEGGLVLLGALLVVLAVDAQAALVDIDPDLVCDVLGLLATGAGAAAVVLGTTAGRIAGNRRAAWLIPALALYCLVVIPTTVLADEEEFSRRPAVLAGCLGVAVLLLAAVRPPRRTGGGTGWLAAGAGALLTLTVGVVDDGRSDGPGLVPWVEAPGIVNVIAMVGWFVVSAAVVVAGFVLRTPPLWRVGLGFGIIAVAHVDRAVTATPSTVPSVTFEALRLLGVVVVLLGMAQLLRRALTRVLSDQFDRQETMRLAVLRTESMAQAAAEREHELRNGLAGLAGLGYLLDHAPDSAADQQARAAAVAEVRRMTAMLDRRPRAAGAGPYDVTRALAEILALWRVGGTTIDASVGADLVAEGCPDVLAQVLTNLLTNCARHAPGAVVRVDARRSGPDVLIRVRDHGILSDGARPAQGLGIGLDLSRRLLRAQAGDLHVHAADESSPGWSVTIRLAAAQPTGSSGDAGDTHLPGAMTRPVAVRSGGT